MARLYKIIQDEHHTLKIKTIAEFYRLRNLPQPEHPLISVVHYSMITASTGSDAFDFYSISIKRGVSGNMFIGNSSMI
ncbi:MAG: hypothetical protein ABIR81_07060 [Ginsengibacter sp.]